MLAHELADGCLLIGFPELTEPEANAAAVAAAQTLARRRPAGLLDAVVGARTLALEFDPRETSSARLESLLGSPESFAHTSGQRTLRVPVVYGGPAGPDLDELARAASMSPADFARRHGEASYRVAFLGFAPGFAYMTGLPEALHSSRLATPRTSVPGGAVAIGGPYTGIYPGATPGGWRLIGKTSVRLFDAAADPPALFRPGDRVVFEAVERLEDARPWPGVPSPPGGEAAAPPPLFRVVSPGVYSSVQGAPRYGGSRFGIPPGGAMDSRSLADGNSRVGNLPGAPALEMTFVGAELEALAPATVSLAGAAAQATFRDHPLAFDQTATLETGDRLRVGPMAAGVRAYLCVAGGLGLIAGASGLAKRLAKGDELVSAQLEVGRSAASSGRVASFDSREVLVRVVLDPRPGPFEQKGVATLLSAVYRVSSSSDRRGLRLEGPPIELKGSSDIAPEGTPLGGIQVARDGMPIVLGPDRPVTGGYARIATVIRADFPLVAQAKPGAGIRFVSVDIAQAAAARVG